MKESEQANVTEKVVATITVPAIAIEDEKALTKEVADIQFRAEALIIEDDADYEAAGQLGVLLKQKAGQVTAFFKPMKDAAYQSHRAVCDREKEMLAPLRTAEAAVKSAMSGYVQKKEQERLELERAQRQAAEAERERKLQEAAELEAAGDQQGAEAAMSDAIVMDEATSYCAPAVAKPKVSGVGTSKDWEIVSIDPAVVPLNIAGYELRPVDRSAVMRLIRSTKGQVSIPGVLFREITKMSFRG